MPNDYNKILVVRFSSLGDIILTTPLLKVLRENFPDAQIDYLTKQTYIEVILNCHNIDSIIAVSNEIPFSELKELKNNLRKIKYDLIIDLHNNLRTIYLRNILRLSGSRILKFKKYSLRKMFLVWFKFNLMKNLPTVITRYILTLNKLIPVDKYLNKQPTEICIDEKSEAKVDKVLYEEGIENNKELVCIVPLSKHFTKTYPKELYIEFIGRLDRNKYNIILIGQGDENYADILKTGKNVYNLFNKFNIPELAELMSRCSYVITGDTGPMHIAEAVNVPIIMLAGSSVKEFGFYPQNKNSHILEVNHLKCRPCSHIGRSECPLGHFKCMKEITPELIQLNMKK